MASYISVRGTALLFGLLAFGMALAGCGEPSPSTDPVRDAPPEEVIEEDLAELTAIEGTWVLVDSRDPTHVFLQIEVTDDQGVVVDAASSRYRDGDVAWQDLTPSGPDAFAYRELDTDGGRIDATLTLVDPNAIEIRLDAARDVDLQSWVRDDGSLVDPAPEPLGCTIDTDTRLTPREGSVDYIVDCVMNVTAPLTIEPGVVVAFASGAGLGVYDEGILVARGTPDAPIVFRGERIEPGFWRGIHTETQSVLEHVRIDSAGSNYVYCCNEAAGVFARDGRLTLVDATIRDSGGFGLVVRPATTITAYQRNTITRSDEAPVKASLSSVSQFDGLASAYEGNQRDVIELVDTGVDVPTTVPPANVPYALSDGVLDITDVLRLEAGVEFVMPAAGGLGVYDNGALELAGTATAPVKIRGDLDIRGAWRGIHIETNSPLNRFTHAEISNAGSNYVYCCRDIATVYLEDGRLSLSDTTLSKGSGYGVYARPDAVLEFDRNTIRTHTEAPLFLSPEQAGELDGRASTYVDNNDNHVRIEGFTIDGATTWPDNGVPYLLAPNTVINVTAGLTVEAGAEVVLEESAGIGVYNDGFLNAVGTAARPIVFRGLTDIPGFWRGIHTETDTSSNELTHVTLRNAGRTYVYCCNVPAALLVRAGTMTVTESTITDNDGCGVSVSAGALLTESGNAFARNEDGDICL
ncbi:MAG: right-handed parallel beta-helix repeat-containing protein [Myxococcota bacterium]